MISKILIAQVFSSVNADKATGFLYSNYCLDNWERRNKADPSTEPFKHSIGCSLGANCTTGGFVLLEMKGSTYSIAETFELADTERIIEPWLNSQDSSMVDLCVDVTFDTLQGKMMQGVTVVEIAADKSVCRKARGGDGNSGAGNSGAGNSGAGNSGAGNSGAGNSSAGNSGDKEPNSEVEDKAEFFGLGKTGAMLVGAGVVAVMILILTAACCLAKKEARQPATSFGSMPAHRAPQQRLPRRRRG